MRRLASSLGLIVAVVVSACGTSRGSPPPSAHAPSAHAAARLPAGTSCGVPPAYVAAQTIPQTPDRSTTTIRPTWSALAAAASGLGAAAALEAIAISLDGGAIATAARVGDRASIQLWSASGQPIATPGKISIAAGTLLVACLAWSPDGKTLAAGAVDGSVTEWSRAGSLLRTLPGTDPIESLAWSPDGWLATGAIHFPAATATDPQTLPGVVRLWSADGTAIRTLGTDFTGGKFFNLGWSPDGSMLAAGVSDYHVWTADGAQVAIVRASGTPAWAMDWSPDGSSLAIGDENGTADVLATSGASRGRRGFSAGVNFLAYSPDGSMLAVAMNSAVSVVRASDLGAVVWSDGVQSPQVRWAADGHSLFVLGGRGLVEYSSDGRLLASLGGCDGNVTAFDLTAGSAVAVTDSGRICAWAVAGS